MAGLPVCERGGSTWVACSLGRGVRGAAGCVGSLAVAQASTDQRLPAGRALRCCVLGLQWQAPSPCSIVSGVRYRLLGPFGSLCERCPVSARVH